MALINGTPGNDTLTSGNAPDTVVGEAGSDTLYGGGNDDVLSGGFGNDALYGGTRHDWLNGGFGNDKLYGDGGHDRLYGDNGNDRLYGGEGNDVLDGGNGSDILDGGNGGDELQGGGGNDLFTFDEGDADVTEWPTDRIFDFTKGDKIDLRLIDANIHKAGDQAFTFVGEIGHTDPMKVGTVGWIEDPVSGTTIVVANVDAGDTAEIGFVLANAYEAVAADFVM